MSDDETKAPDKSSCKKITDEFAKITHTNEALAETFLSEHKWDLERAVSSFYDVIVTDGDCQKSKKPKTDFSVNFFLSEQLHSSKSTPSTSLYDPSTVEKLFGEGKTVTTEPPPRMKLLSWNLDGLDVQNLKRRTRAVIKLIQKHEPDIIFFQEVIPESAEYFESKLPEYKCIKGGDTEYFIMTLIRVFTIFYDSHYIVDYPNSQMGRNLLITEAHMGKIKLQLLNTHLESTTDHSLERRNQLKIAFDNCKSFSSDYTVIFGGDLNLRDKEVEVPNNVFDLWEFCGARKEFKYTWDMTKNTNNSSNFGKFRPKCRFDRIYFRFSALKQAKPKHFALIGFEKVPQTQSFPSDHWGVVILFDLDHSL